jgi:hypothetical protein
MPAGRGVGLGDEMNPAIVRYIREQASHCLQTARAAIRLARMHLLRLRCVSSRDWPVLLMRVVAALVFAEAERQRARNWRALRGGAA